MLRNVRLPQCIHITQQYTSHIKSDVSLAYNDGTFTLELRIKACVLRQPVVPAYKFASRVHALEVLTRNAQLFVLRGSVRKEKGIVVGSQLGEGDVVADVDVANEIEAV